MKHIDSSGADAAVTSIIDPAGTAGTGVDCRRAGSLAIASVISVDTNAAANFATSAIGTNEITLIAHGYKTGLVGQFTTDGNLPTGLSTSTNYYVVVIDANTISVAASYANATAGTPTVVTFTATGASGTGTFTPTVLASCTVQPQWSPNNSAPWFNYGSATTITESVNYGFPLDRPPANYFRLFYAIASGSLTIANTFTTAIDS